MNKEEKLKKQIEDLQEQIIDLCSNLVDLGNELDKTRNHNKASAKWYKNLSKDKKKIRNLKHLLRYYENKQPEMIK